MATARVFNGRAIVAQNADGEFLDCDGKVIEGAREALAEPAAPAAETPKPDVPKGDDPKAEKPADKSADKPAK